MGLLDTELLKDRHAISNFMINHLRQQGHATGIPQYNFRILMTQRDNNDPTIQTHGWYLAELKMTAFGSAVCSLRTDGKRSHISVPSM